MIQLINGDCLEEMKNIPDGSVDMVLTDPPYGMDYQSNGVWQQINLISFQTIII